MQLSKEKSQYYTEAFAYREATNTAKERVTRDSVIIAEVKLNHCVSSLFRAASIADPQQLESEQDFLIDLSFQLSDIYQRPATCIMVIVNSDVAMLLGGDSGPAYHMTITALPSEIAATKNKRNSFLIQDFMLEALKISPKRGVLRYEVVGEENLATNGMTALQEIEHLERQSTEENGVLRTISRQRSRRSKKSGLPVYTERGKAPVSPSRVDTPLHRKFGTADSGDTKSTGFSGPERKRVKKRKSFMSLFRRWEL